MAASQGGIMLSLKTMTVSKLKVLKREVEAAIQAKVTERRDEIESELSKLFRLDGGGRGRVVRAAAIGADAAKYRNPEPTLKAGRKNESLFADSPKASALKQPKKARKTKKVRNAGDIAPAVLLASAKIELTEPLRIEPLDCPLPVEPLSRASLYPDNIPGDLGGDPIAAVAP
jgi:hypothetical protein